MKKGIYRWSALSLAFLFLGSCNIFDPIDSPTTDEQLLSAARACFDRGDLECARQEYEKLSGDYRDIALAERTFILLDQQGVTMREFIAAFGGGQGTAGINYLAGLLGPSSGLSRRTTFYNIYNQHKSITVGSDLRAFVRFVTAMILLSELLGEAAGSDAILQRDDISLTGATCKELSNSSCAADASCNPPSTGRLLVGAAVTDYSSTNTVPAGADATLYMVQEAAEEVVSALTQLNVSGSFSSGVSSVLNRWISVDLSVGGVQPCFRSLLLSQGLGVAG